MRQPGWALHAVLTNDTSYRRGISSFEREVAGKWLGLAWLYHSGVVVWNTTSTCVTKQSVSQGNENCPLKPHSGQPVWTTTVVRSIE